MNGLMLHCGANEVPRSEVTTIRTPAPFGKHYPIPHIELIEEVEGALNGNGLSVVEQAHALTKEGDRYFGLFSLEADDPLDDYTTVLGLRNSHDQSFSAGMVVGHRVFVCDNLAFSGEIKVMRKHTRYISEHLPALVQRAVQQIPPTKQVMKQRIDRYKHVELDPHFVDFSIMEMFRQKVIAPSKIRKVWDEWDKPSHEEFAETPSAWRLFNAATESLKGRVAVLPAVTMKLHNIIDGVCDEIAA